MFENILSQDHRLTGPLISLRRPSTERIARFLAEQELHDFSYAAVGATKGTPPQGYIVDRTRTKLGEGERTYRSAKSALQNWQQFQLGWLEVWPPATPIVPGQTVIVIGRALRTWWLNACRIIYVIDESNPVFKFGFAYGTLPGHIESGEERFTVEWDQSTGDVCYEVTAFSKPNHLLSRIGYPAVRRMQKRFAKETAASMLRAVRPS
jgi:uncharacterized protein (UPF0548 family)